MKKGGFLGKMDEKTMEKLKKDAEARLKAMSVEELIHTLHTNYIEYRETSYDMQKLNAEHQKVLGKIDEVKKQANLTAKDLKKIEALNKEIARIKKDADAKQEFIQTREPEFVVAQELISKVFKFSFRVSEITSVLILSLKLRQATDSFLSGSVKDALSYKKKVAY
jgi:predicted Mrr-cat superfamily restriction endonuclease